LNDSEGFVFIFIILAVAASEAAIGLAIFLTYFRNKNNINIDQINSLKG
jgi:NADH-quinone oxidoreductase subunit K